MTSLGMILAGIALMFIWAAVKDEDPRDIVRKILTNKGATPKAGA